MAEGFIPDVSPSARIRPPAVDMDYEDWHERAECVVGGHDPDLWSPEGRTVVANRARAEAARICTEVCTVRPECITEGYKDHDNLVIRAGLGYRNLERAYKLMDKGVTAEQLIAGIDSGEIMFPRSGQKNSTTA